MMVTSETIRHDGPDNSRQIVGNYYEEGRGQKLGQFGPTFLKQLMDLCRRTGLGTTRLLRKLITDTELKAKPTPELREVLRAMDRIGNNLNQLAHRANTIGLIDQAEWDRVKALHRELREEVYRWR